MVGEALAKRAGLDPTVPRPSAIQLRLHVLVYTLRLTQIIAHFSNLAPLTPTPVYIDTPRHHFWYHTKS